MSKIKIGVFDSGIGGLSVVKAIQKELPDYEVLFKNDAEHVPYGNRDIEEIYQFTKPIIQDLVSSNCQAIVIACNTVTTNLIERLRRDFKIPFVGMEPMIKPAAEHTESRIIAVCATPRTLQSQRYRWLKEAYAKDIKVVEPDCSEWALMVETDQVDRQKISKTIEEIIGQGADVIVLGCTHYHWIEEQIKELASDRARVLQPEVPVIAQLKTVLDQNSTD
jgi:glutamate racemase